MKVGNGEGEGGGKDESNECELNYMRKERRWANYTHAFNLSVSLLLRLSSLPFALLSSIFLSLLCPSLSFLAPHVLLLLFLFQTPRKSRHSWCYRCCGSEIHSIPRKSSLLRSSRSRCFRTFSRTNLRTTCSLEALHSSTRLCQETNRHSLYS